MWQYSITVFPCFIYPGLFFILQVQEIAQALSRLIRCDSVPWKLCNGSKWHFSHFRNLTSYMTRISCQLSRLRVPGTSRNLKVTYTDDTIRQHKDCASARQKSRQGWKDSCVTKGEGIESCFGMFSFFQEELSIKTRRLRLGGLRGFVGCVHCLDCPLWIGFVHSSTAAIFERSERFG